MTVRLVELGPEDWREFREVRLAALREAPHAFGSTYADWQHAPEGRWRARLTEVPLTVVARDEGRPVGVASGAEDADAVELISMWVDPDRRGTGLVDRLVERVVAWAAERGKPVFLMVRDDNEAARRAYERLGFVDHGVPADQPADQPADEPPERLLRHRGGAS